MKWFTSDLHIAHKKVLSEDFDNRPFKSIEEHDAIVVENINDTVSKGDVVYHLGDLAWTREGCEFFFECLRKDITLVLIKGSHDYRSLVKYRKGLSMDDVKMLKDGPGIFLSHYPHRSWPKSHHGSIHLYGHVHGQLPGIGRSMDVGCMIHDFKPISLDEVFETLLPIPFDTQK